MFTTQLEVVRNIIIPGYADPVVTVISRMSELVFRREEGKKIYLPVFIAVTFTAFL